MKLSKIFSRKSPEEKLNEDFNKLVLNGKKINFLNVLSKHDSDIVLELINKKIKNGKLDSTLVGTKGWALLSSKAKLEEVDKLLNKGPVDLKIHSDNWDDFGKKRVFLLLESMIDANRSSETGLLRDGDTVFSKGFIKQSWLDAINKFELEDKISYSKIIEVMGIESIYHPMIEKYILEEVKSDKSNIVIGSDQIVRWRTSIKEASLEYIKEAFENNQTTITYEDLANKLGVTSSEIGKIILELIDNNSLENITNYPIDEQIVLKS